MRFRSTASGLTMNSVRFDMRALSSCPGRPGGGATVAPRGRLYLRFFGLVFGFGAGRGFGFAAAFFAAAFFGFALGFAFAFAFAFAAAFAGVPLPFALASARASS